MKKTIALLAAMLTLTACNGVRAEVGAIPTAAPPAPAPTPYVVIVKEPAPAVDESATFTRAMLAAAAVFLLIICAGITGAVAAIATQNLRKREPERSQLNESPTYIAPLPERAINQNAIAAPMNYPIMPDSWSMSRKAEYLISIGIPIEEARAHLDSQHRAAIAKPNERRQLPPPRR